MGKKWRINDQKKKEVYISFSHAQIQRMILKKRNKEKESFQSFVSYANQTQLLFQEK